ncbi:histone H1-like [Scyliorhinus canicula]|uniref:histone H1-like n=1 Tax=Scyliorhinus canicula TaxID=7830 RepID=UPI0018F50997|nr:histone H1-like [Scyliorhinus canicula]
MSDSAATETAPPAAAPVKAVKKQRKVVPRKKSEGPGLGELICKIVADSGDRKGVSLQAIKKQLRSKEVDVDKRGYQIKQSVKRSVDNGSLAQVKGTGASGSFKIVKKTSGVAKKPAAKKTSVKKPAAKKFPKKAAAKKSPKKTAAKKSPKKTSAKKTPKKAAAKKVAAPKKSAKKAAPKKSSPVKKTTGGIKQIQSRVKPKVKSVKANKPAKK